MSFPQFSLLPPELQLRIWQFSLPAPRVVDLFAVPVSESLQPRFARPSTSPSSTSSTSTASEDSTAPIVTKWIRTFVERIYTQPQDLGCLHICSEARRTLLKQYVKVNADIEFRGDMSFECLEPVVGRGGEERMYCLGSLKGSRPFGLLDPERDIVLLQDPPRMRDRTGGFVTSSLGMLSRWLGRDVLCRLRRLAIPYYTWRKTKTYGSLKLLFGFEGLEELYVSFIGDGSMGRERGGVGRTWCDVVGGSENVGGLWSHVREVEDEVKADIEGLKREWREWKVPRVRVVRHRGVLVETLQS